MPTEEPKKLLDREFSSRAARPITDIASPLLRELVNAGLMVFLRCETEAANKGGENEDVTALVLYRHMIELTDGIEVLVLQGCGTAAIPLLRSEFEASLGLSYLVEDIKVYVQRLSWLVANVHAGIKARQLLEPGTQSGKEYAQSYRDEFGRAVPSVPNATLAAEIMDMQQGLQNAQFSPIEAEYPAPRRSC